ncbi:TolC family protein [Psychromonas antarctica]|uniref:TolC family protein n=1 Tax=Psychromonas antarctica TaxID=67573 RepID=UPI001EE81BBC|nr:TolC family protein [Psychromonas antarctica]MCG6201689.1 TolC family protein [Psychromonas antarctica]
MMKISRYFLLNKALFSLSFLLSFNLFALGISLSEAEQIAIKSDPAQQIYQYQQASLIAQGSVAGTLPDPMIKLGMANLPTDSFALDEDPMTQLTFGLAQQFSRGSQLALSQKGFNQQSQLAVLQGLARQLTVKKNVQQLWFNILFVEKSLTIIKQNKQLFSGFYADLQTQFSLGLADNDDLIAAEIALGKFSEKIASLTQQSLTYRSLLSEWIGQNAYQQLPSDIPQWPQTLAYVDAFGDGNGGHYALLSGHPKAKMLTQNIALADNGIALAEQDYLPSFKVEVGYGHRLSETAMGERRSDLLSAFISMDIPLFTDKRQDQKLIAAQQIKGQKQAEQRLLLRQLNRQLTTEIVNYRQLKMRQTRYQDSLLKQAKQQVKLLEESYQSNTRPFKAVIAAYIHQQSLSLEYQQLYFDGLKSLSNIRYFQAL